MSDRTIPTGATEPITATVLDTNGDPLVGKTDIKVKVRRQSDDQWLDWSDMTFKAGGSVAQLLQALGEVSQTFAPGDYELDFDTSAIANPVADDIYHFTVMQDVGTDADNLPLNGDLEVGTWRDLLLQQSVVVLQSFSYNRSTDVLEGNVWVEQGGVLLVTPTVVSVTFYDNDGNALFTMTTAGPDANGFFKATKSAPGFIAGESVYSIATVTDPAGPFDSGKGSFVVG